MTEAHITVEGKTLSQAQSMAVRVAITAFLMQLRTDKQFYRSLGMMAEVYNSKLTDVLTIILDEPIETETSP